MSRRRQKQLIAQYTGREDVGDPPPELPAGARQVWFQLLAAAPPVVRLTDARMLALVCERIADWRGGRLPGQVRELYRDLGLFFVSMPVRRQLLFPDRPPRRARGISH
jgi:hypothetical protein